MTLSDFEWLELAPAVLILVGISCDPSRALSVFGAEVGKKASRFWNAGAGNAGLRKFGEAGQTKAPRPKRRGAERNVAPAGQTSGLPVNPENRYDQFSSGLIREIPDKEAS